MSGAMTSLWRAPLPAAVTQMISRFFTMMVNRPLQKEGWCIGMSSTTAPVVRWALEILQAAPDPVTSPVTPVPDEIRQSLLAPMARMILAACFYRGLHEVLLLAETQT